MKESSEEKKRKGKSDTGQGHPAAGGTGSTVGVAGQGDVRVTEGAGIEQGPEVGEAGEAGILEGQACASETEDSGEVPLPESESPVAERDRLLREKLEMEDKILRLRADFENFRKRANREKANLIQYGNEALLRDLLPLVDNLERALNLRGPDSAPDPFRAGIEMVLADIHKTLGKYGVRVMEALGRPFDPNLHEALQRVETDQAAPQTVVEEFQKGYEFRETLLRPAKVAVAAALSGADTTAGEQTAEDGGCGEGAGARPPDEAGKIIN